MPTHNQTLSVNRKKESSAEKSRLRICEVLWAHFGLHLPLKRDE